MKIGYDREQSENYREKYGAVILAAGLSSRMKAFKPLLPVAGTTAIEGQIDSAKAAGIDDITVVVGHNREELEPVLRNRDVRIAFNPDYETGMLSSIKAGLKAAAESGKEGYLLMPVDCPLISVRVMREVMSSAVSEMSSGLACVSEMSSGDVSQDSFEMSRGTRPQNSFRQGKAENSFQASFRVATFEGKKGHPLLVPAEYIDEICDFDGEGGLAAVTDRHEVIRVETGEEGCVLDMDTPEGYEDIKNFVARGYAREKLELLTARKRIFLVRHGETEQHDEPLFMGQYDVPLNDEGRRQAEELGRKIAEAMREDVEAEVLGMDKFGKEPMPAIERIYCSDLTRARETAEIICKKVNDILPNPVNVKALSGLREINLGPWDGRPVREIKQEYPAEYEKRGQNLMTFKMRGCGAENFYDMQYRAVGALRELLRYDDAKDIIIVAHSGVCRALEQNINGRRVHDRWEPMDKGSFRIFEPFPQQPSEKVNSEDKPMTSDSLTMEAVLQYYE